MSDRILSAADKSVVLAELDKVAPPLPLLLPVDRSTAALAEACMVQLGVAGSAAATGDAAGAGATGDVNVVLPVPVPVAVVGAAVTSSAGAGAVLVTSVADTDAGEGSTGGNRSGAEGGVAATAGMLGVPAATAPTAELAAACTRARCAGDTTGGKDVGELGTTTLSTGAGLSNAKATVGAADTLDQAAATDNAPPLPAADGVRANGLRTGNTASAAGAGPTPAPVPAPAPVPSGKGGDALGSRGPPALTTVPLGCAAAA